MSEQGSPRNLFGVRDGSQDPDDALRFENPRAELDAVRRELLARLVTVISRRVASSTVARPNIAPSYRSNRLTDPSSTSRDANAGSSDSTRFDISTSGPRFTHWYESLLGLALIGLGLALSAPLAKITLWSVGGVVLIHSGIRGLRGK
jgi:hypothetical protein